MNYLENFFHRLKQGWKGSLISVSEARQQEGNAKKFLSLLAKKQGIQRVAWGWYWIPCRYEDFFDFLRRDCHFKVLQKQTAASFWNGDFVHRDSYSVAVSDESFARALREFSKKQGWKVTVEVRYFEAGEYETIDGLIVQSLEETIVDCLKEWAFADAFSALYENSESVRWERLEEHYWERIPGTSIRVGQVLKAGAAAIHEYTQRFGPTRARVSDEFVERQIEEAVEKVAKLG